MSRVDNRILSGNRKVDGAYHTVEWLITAFAGTLVFIVFVMQVYRIPTGSMAETLRGAHYRIRCPQCGYRYDHDFVARNYGLPDTVTPAKEMVIVPRSPVCPTCGFSNPNPMPPAQDGRIYIYENGRSVPASPLTVFKGDQIFVLKSVYQFFEPNRWDVIVFKNPLEPRINYIKRCIGLPGETVQLIDGDVYINGQIARKPEKVQEELWMLVYDNDHQPIHPEKDVFYANNNLTDVRQKDFHKVAWEQPFNAVDPDWNLEIENGTIFELNSSGTEVRQVAFNDRYGRGFRATYAYDDPGGFPNMPIASDLMVQYYLSMEDNSTVGAQIRKEGQTFRGTVTSDGTLEIARITDSGAETLQRETVEAGKTEPLTRFRLAAIDRQIVLQYGDTKILHDLGTGIVPPADRQNMPAVHIIGTGKARLAHLALYRDIHYTLVDLFGRPAIHALPDQPMVLKEDQFFVCGDNSPASYDSRFWDKPGKGNGDFLYDPGVVPRDYLVGKAFFVHWPGGYRLRQEPIRWIPFVDGMKVIYGGKD